MIEKSLIEIKLGSYGVAASTALTDYTILPKVQEYRRTVSGRMYPLDKEDITRKIPAADYLVSKKIDGEFSVVYFDNDVAFSINPGGTVRVGLPFIDEVAKRLKGAGYKQAMLAGEMYKRHPDGRRARVHDISSLVRQPSSAEHLQQIGFAVFDFVEVDGQPVDVPFAETWSKIDSMFEADGVAHPVETTRVSTAPDLARLFDKWVVEQGNEGLVVRSDEAGFFKIKPRHTIDAVVIGFTESGGDRQGMLHDLLVAIVRRDSAIHVLTRVGGGFTDDQRREMLSDLKDMVVDSEYAEVNSDHVAYQMVEPEWVIEVSCLDLISQTTRGAPVNRMALNWNAQARRFEVIRRLPLVSVISPQFVRKREDKQVNPDDVRIEQISERVEVPMADRDATQMTLPKSQLMEREVYTKQLKGETMVRKFMLWKTNKETESEDYPAYVAHFTDFSPNRKVPLAREVRVSNAYDQVLALLNQLKEANIKKGWELFSDGDELVPSGTPAEEKSDSTKEPGSTKKKTTTKKTATKKSSTKKKTAKKSGSSKKSVKKTATKKTAKKATAKKATAKKTSTKKAAKKTTAKKSKKKS